VVSDERRPRSVYGVGEDPDPRFSLANERTALAAIRTSLAVIAGGVATAALVQLDVLPGALRTIAVVLCALGGLMALSSIRRWRRVERALRLREPLPAPEILSPAALVVAVVAIGVIVLVVWKAL
jgi:putative membrane protein